MHPGVSHGEETRPGWWVRAARKSAGKTREELEQLTDVHRTTVYKWEHPKRTVPWVTWLGILHALGLPADWRPPSTDVADDDDEES
jgi:transcriptional regulator with XRE-family HTH domain